MRRSVPMRQLVTHAVGGGWGYDAATSTTDQVAVIRGADFPAVVLGDVAHVPVRWEERTKLPSRLLQPGDLVLEISGGTSDRPTGRSVFASRRLLENIGRPTIPASFCRLVRIDATQADPYYVYWWLQGMYAAGRTWAYQNRSTGIANFQFEHFLDSEMVDVPPIDEQRGIAATLGALDDKIESNRRGIQLLWKLLGAEYDLRALGAPVVELRLLLHLEYGKSLPATVRQPGEVPVYGSNGVTGTHNAPLIAGPGVIVGRKGSVGEVHWTHKPSFPIDTTYFVTPTDGYPLLACYFALLRAGLTNMNSHSAIPGLNRESALAKTVQAPTLEVACDWATSRQDFLDEIVHLEAETSTLIELRDTLLPELLSGRIRVPEAREAVAEVAGSV